MRKCSVESNTLQAVDADIYKQSLNEVSGRRNAESTLVSVFSLTHEGSPNPKII